MKHNRQSKPDRGRVLQKLQKLSDRVPGRTAARVAKQRKTLIACQLVLIADDRIIIQLGQEAYELPLAVIEDIQAIDNPIEVERSTGVDVVVMIRNWNPVQAERGTIGKAQVPFPLVKGPTNWGISPEDHAVLKARTERWMKLTGLLSHLPDAKGQNTLLYEGCTVATSSGSGDFVCDTYDTEQGGIF